MDRVGTIEAVSNLQSAWAEVNSGESVTIRPRGSSMVGLVESGAEVHVAPCDPDLLTAGDIVLVKVTGRYYLHKVLGRDKHRVRIGNNRGGVNGWTPASNAAGIATRIAGRAVSGAQAKLRPSSPSSPATTESSSTVSPGRT